MSICSNCVGPIIVAGLEYCPLAICTDNLDYLQISERDRVQKCTRPFYDNLNIFIRAAKLVQARSGEISAEGVTFTKTSGGGTILGWVLLDLTPR